MTFKPTQGAFDHFKLSVKKVLDTMLASGFLVSGLLYGLTVVNAAPSFSKRQSITALSTTQITPYRPFTHFASTAYCNPSTTITWNCGGMSQIFPLAVRGSFDLIS